MSNNSIIGCQLGFFLSIVNYYFGIISQQAQMSQPLYQNQNKKSARFSSLHEVFNYTAQKTEEDDNSLLLTPKDIKPREDENLLSQKRSKNKQAMASRREHKEVELKRKSLAEKKENFKKRLSMFPANSEQNQNHNNNQATTITTINQATAAKESIQSGRKLDVQRMVVEQPAQMKQAEHKIKGLQEEKKAHEPLSSAEQKTKMASYNQFTHNNPEPGAKMVIEEANDVSTQNIKPKNNRITMDCRSFLMELGIFAEQNQEKSSQERQPSKNRTQANSDFLGNNQPQSLVSKAIRRLSDEGRRVSMMKKNSRVTLNLSEVQSLLAQYEPNDSLIKSLRKQADDRHQAQVKQKQKQNQFARRQYLQKYFSEQEQRQTIVRQNLEKIRFDRQGLLSNIKRLDEIQNQLDQQIKLKKMESNQNMRKIQALQSSRYNPEEVEQLLIPINYLEKVYSVKIIEISSKSQGPLCQSKNYQIKFIIDEFLYCKIVANEGENKALVIPFPMDFQKRTSNWSIDLKLRLELMTKYCQKSLYDCEPIASLMRLGTFWQSLEKIQSDFQMIDELFELLELNLDESKDQLSFRMQLRYDTAVQVRVNFLRVGKEGYFSIDDGKYVIQSKGKVQLLQFVTEYIANMKS